MSEYKEIMFRDLRNRYYVVKPAMPFIGEKFPTFSKEFVLILLSFFVPLTFLSLL